MTPSATRMSAFLIMIVIAFAGGCVQIGDGVVDGGGDGDGLVADDQVLVVFRNLTGTEAVDVEFHATNEPVQTLPGDLFVEAFRVTSGIGLAGTGILAPLAVDAIEFPCTDDLTLGTAGGSFLDNSTGDETGRGVPRWAEAAPLGLCGSIITFTFTDDGDGFTVNVAVTR